MIDIFKSKNLLLFIFAALSHLFSFLPDTFSWRNTLTFLDAVLKQLAIIHSFAILFSREGVYALSPFLTPHLPFNPSQLDFCSYNISKFLWDQQMLRKLLYSVVSLALQHNTVWVVCPQNLWLPKLHVFFSIPHYWWLNLDLDKYSTTEQNPAPFYFLFPCGRRWHLTKLPWLGWPWTYASSAQASQVTGITDLFHQVRLTLLFPFPTINARNLDQIFHSSGHLLTPHLDHSHLRPETQESLRFIHQHPSFNAFFSTE